MKAPFDWVPFSPGGFYQMYLIFQADFSSAWTMSIGGVMNPLQVNVFPKPAKGRFTNVYPAAFKNSTLQLFDAGGRLVQQQLLTQINSQIVSTANLQNGVDSMLLQKGNKKITKQVIIKK